MLDNEEVRQVIDEPPPFLESWPRVYVVVIIWLIVIIAVFYAFTRAWTP